MQKFIMRIDEERPEFLEDFTAECYVVRADLGEDFCMKLIKNAAQGQRIVLFYGEEAVQAVKKYQADGVVLDLGVDDLKIKMQNLRRELGKGKYIGLFTRNRRHESMLVSEVEPDFVIFKVWKDGFDKIKELTDWYNAFFLLPSAAWLMDEDVSSQDLQTDFVIRPL